MADSPENSPKTGGQLREPERIVHETAARFDKETIGQFAAVFAEKIVAAERTASRQFWIGQLVTICGILIGTLWLGRTQERVAEETVAGQVGSDLSGAWRETFSSANRFRFERLRTAISTWDDRPNGPRQEALWTLIDNRLCSDARSIRGCTPLFEFLQQDLVSDGEVQGVNADGLSPFYEAKLVRLASDYRSTAIQALNTMELVREVYRLNDTIRAKRMINTAFSEITRTWTDQLRDFIQLYRGFYYRQTEPAWNILLAPDGTIFPDFKFEAGKLGFDLENKPVPIPPLTVKPQASAVAPK
jgi:hypothetical protein